jgi:hypothetical protein
MIEWKQWVPIAQARCADGSDNACTQYWVPDACDRKRDKRPDLKESLIQQRTHHDRNVMPTGTADILSHRVVRKENILLDQANGHGTDVIGVSIKERKLMFPHQLGLGPQNTVYWTLVYI